MAESTIVKVKRDGLLTFKDGTLPAALEYAVSFEAGDLSIAIPGPSVSLFLDRGIMSDPPAIRFADDQPMTGTFTAQFRDVTDAAAPILVDILTNSGFFAASWVSTGGANAEIKTVDLVWQIEGTDHGDPADHTITLKHCFVTGSIAEGDPTTVSISFTAYALYPDVT